MANDLFGSLGLGGRLGGLVKGLSSIMPQDDPAVKMMNAQTEVSELKAKEESLYTEIGKIAVHRYGLDAFPEQADTLLLVQKNMTAAESRLSSLKKEQEDAQNAAKAEEEAKKRERAAYVCPSCGYENAEGTKFCNECGTKLGQQKKFCGECGAELQAGVSFCGECGARQEI